jgi:hypothetical protein
MRWRIAQGLARVVLSAQALGFPIRPGLIYLLQNTLSIMQAHTLRAPRLLFSGRVLHF